MNIEELREYCLSVRGASESFPFNDRILVFKVMGKVFLMIDIEPRDGCFTVDVKCDPERSVDLRERYTGVAVSHYADTLLWNSVVIDGDVPDSLVCELISHSVDEVVKKLSKRLREEYCAGEDCPSQNKA